MNIKYLFFLLIIFCFRAQGQVTGCTDPLAENYNPQATVNDGSCTYAAAAVAPETSVSLPAAVTETSGLIKDGEYLYTHNDNSDTSIYALDSITGAIEATYPVTGAVNQDWEEVAQDEDYIYIGDFGNNANGNRQNLHILKISRESLLSGNPQTEVISFSYSNQTDFTPAGVNNTDFDCEAFVVSQDSIYLFTKQWVSLETAVYVLPKIAGIHVAELRASYNVNGLITGAAYLEDKSLVVLSGYSPVLQPFLYLLYDFNGHEFFSGNKRRVSLSLPFHQTEGITTSNGLDYFITNENFATLAVPQRLHHVNLAPYLEDYLESQQLGLTNPEAPKKALIYPNPANTLLFIEGIGEGSTFSITGLEGKTVLSGSAGPYKNSVDISGLAAGNYIVKINGTETYRLVKR